ncbi:hypothetical protein HK097_002326 [Rhizophlyctis rosea]|uniref:Uncharacterized protein n=1 Tax=Rhizophlyctis rosea TaxID=64517 RepID=A0AAD5XA10_9FUNG|nr:hypothetical protein HK097_002326 [Rhizophlyctis rosea]
MFLFKAAVVAAMLRRGPATASSYTPRSAASSPFADVAFAGAGPAGFKPAPAFDPSWMAGKTAAGRGAGAGAAGATAAKPSPTPKTSRTSNPPPPPPPGNADLSPRIPPMLSAICLAILANKANAIRRERQRRLQIAALSVNSSMALTGMATAAEKKVLLKGLDVKLMELVKGADSVPVNAEEANKQKEALIPVEAVVAAGHLLQRWTGRDRVKCVGKKIKVLPRIGTTRSHHDPILMDESDEEVLSSLNEQYPPLLDIVGGGPCILSESAIETAVVLSMAPAQPMPSIVPHPAALTKHIFTHLTDTASTLATQILTLVTSWITDTSATLTKSLLPSELQEEINFLSEYIRLCVQAEQVLQLPLMFPGEYEVDAEGGVTGLKRPVGVFVVRMLARGVVGGVVGLAMYIGLGRRHLPVEDENTHASDSDEYGGDDVLAAMDGEVEGGVPVRVVPLESHQGARSVSSSSGYLSTSPSREAEKRPSVYDLKAAASTLPSPPPTPAPGATHSFPSSNSSESQYSSSDETEEILRSRRIRLPDRLMRVEYEMFVAESGDEGDGEEDEDFDEDGVDAW